MNNSNSQGTDLVTNNEDSDDDEVVIDTINSKMNMMKSHETILTESDMNNMMFHSAFKMIDRQESIAVF